jgi:hypothetical protein
MKQDRFLIGILVGILILVAAALGVFFTRQTSQGYLPEDSPEAVIHNYIYAIQQKDFGQAYSYLAAEEDKPSQGEFQSMISTELRPGNTGVRIVETRIIDNETGAEEAIVEMVIIEGGGPFDSGYSHNETARLLYQDGSWKIFYMPYPFWGWEWYQPDHN